MHRVAALLLASFLLLPWPPWHRSPRPSPGPWKTLPEALYPG